MTSTGALHLGTAADTDERVEVDAEDLTTHGVIVGMTGSGKTGLGIVALEEALLSGIPTLVLDPKGDMANLCLTFPRFRGEDFRPWIDEAEAQREGRTPEDHAAAKAELWQGGTARSGITPERMQALADVDVTIYTPGATTGVGLDLVGRLDVPADADPQAVNDEVTDLVSGLLALVDVDSDPLTGREHILLTNLLTDAWGKGESLGLPDLVARVQDPPLRKLGVMDLDTFFPAKDRMGLAMRLNGMLASPTFAAWAQGAPLDIQRMLFGDDGSARCAVVSLAHLDDNERQFVVTLVLSRLITWMRGQSGTSSLRAMVYMDEVFGFVPPVANPPAKQPILTILKQARAFGVGMVLSTQNPVDLDYKAISNAGTWMIGRLQTERDRDRLLEGMRSADGAVDIDAVAAAISSLDKRQFVLHSAKDGGRGVFGTRWAMNYLAGPLTGPQIAQLMADKKAELAAAATTASAPATPPPTTRAGEGAAAGTAAAVPAPPAGTTLAGDESTVAPTVPDEVVQRYLDPAAAWAGEVGAIPGGTRLEPHVAIRVRMTFDETKAGLDHTEEFEAVLPVNDDPKDLSGLATVDYDDRDLREDAPDGAVWVIPEAKIGNKTWWKSVEVGVRDELYRTRTMTVLHNTELDCWSRPAETREAFEQRCEVLSEQREDEEAAKVRDRFATKTDRITAAMRTAQDRVAQLEADVSSRKSSELINIGSSILGGFLGGRKSARGVAADLRRAASKRGTTSRTQQRLDTAQGKLVDAQEDLIELEQELSAELMDIDHRWMQAASAIEEVEVDLEKNDIDLVAVTLVWVPTAAA